jgi:hypothetical protein
MYEVHDEYESVRVMPCETYVYPYELNVEFKEELECEADEYDEYLKDITNVLTANSINEVLDLPYGDMHINILGDNFIYKSAERTKVKYKTKYNLNLKLFNE